jgi:hypothetical protein
MALPKYDEGISDVHAFVETRNMNPRDQQLRAAGFRIHERKNGKDAVWERRGEFFVQGEAEALVKMERAAALRRLQDEA